MKETTTNREGGEKLHRIERDVLEMRNMVDSFDPWDIHDGIDGDCTGWADRHKAMFELLREAGNIIGRTAWSEEMRDDESSLHIMFEWLRKLESLCGIPAFWRAEED